MLTFLEKNWVLNLLAWWHSSEFICNAWTYYNPALYTRKAKALRGGWGKRVWNRNRNGWLPFQPFGWKKSHSDFRVEWKWLILYRTQSHSLLWIQIFISIPIRFRLRTKCFRGFGHSDSDSKPFWFLFLFQFRLRTKHPIRVVNARVLTRTITVHCAPWVFSSALLSWLSLWSR